MNKKTRFPSLKKRGVFLSIFLFSLVLCSCEEQSISPDRKPNEVQDFDPPKDTTPVKPPGT